MVGYPRWFWHHIAIPTRYGPCDSAFTHVLDIERLLTKVKVGHVTSDTTSPMTGIVGSALTGKEHHVADLAVEGSVQQAISLLPYTPNILIKLGPRGVLCVRLSPKGRRAKDESLTLCLNGPNVDVVMRYFPGLQHRGIVSVTGAGFYSCQSDVADFCRDTFSGVLMAQLGAGNEIDEAINVAQQAAVITLSSPHAVSERIQQLRA